LNKKILFLSPFIISLAISISATFLFSDISNFYQDNDRLELFIIKADRAVRNSVEIDRHLTAFPDLANDLFWRKSLLQSITNLNDNAVIIQSQCDEQISKRIDHFINRIRIHSDEFLNEENDQEKRMSAFLKLKTDTLKIKEIIDHSVKRKKTSIKFLERKKVKKFRFYFFSFLGMFLFISTLATIIIIYLSTKIKQLTGSIESKKGVDHSKKIMEIEKKLTREQMISTRKGVLLDTIPLGIVAANTDGKIVFANRKMYEWFNISDNVLGEEVEQVLSDLNIDRRNKKFKHNENIYETSFFSDNGEEFCIIRNVTDSEEMSRKLIDSERLVSIGEMASRITHEIRNPLSTIKFNSEYLLENVQGLTPPQITGSMEMIVKEVVRLEQITEKYMNMVRYRSDDPENCTVTNLPVDLVELISFHSGEFLKRGIEIKIVKCEDMVIPISASSFKEIMLNLFKNGWEELQNGGSINVFAELKGSTARIVVEDSGKGIPEDEREIVFKNFYTKKPGGTGIGLSHSRKLAVETGGQLFAADSSLGGIAMVLELPVKNL